MHDDEAHTQQPPGARDAPGLLAAEFETHRVRLRSVARRMLGSEAEADDAVQEAWLRLTRVDADEVANLGGWLTTVVARICLDLLRTRVARREEPLARPVASDASATAHVSALDSSPAAPGWLGGPGAVADPESEAVLADAVGAALVVVLDALSPAERLAFVLHDMFAVPFEQIGAIVGRSPDAAKMLASRARRRVQGARTVPDTDLGQQREIVAAFLAASRKGDFEGLLTLLAPDAVVRSDAAAAAMGSDAVARGAAAVARTFSGRALAARPALLDGVAGAAWAHGGQTRVLFSFTVTGGRISAIALLADPDLIAATDVVFLRTRANVRDPASPTGPDAAEA